MAVISSRGLIRFVSVKISRIYGVRGDQDDEVP